MEHKSGCSHTNCNATSTNPSVCQTLSEMDWERSLWNAAFSGEKERVEKLIHNSRNPKDVVNSEDKSGYTPLHYAARNGHVDICRILLQNGAFIDTQTRCGGATPLHKAAAAEAHKNAVHLMVGGHCCSWTSMINPRLGTPHKVEHKCIATPDDQVGMPWISKESMVKFLIDSGACLQIRDVDGKTVIDKAVDNGHSTLVDIFLVACPDLKYKTKVAKSNAI